MRYAFAGDRKVAVEILSFIIRKGFTPAALFVSDDSKATHSSELIELANLNEEFVFKGTQCIHENALKILSSLSLDYIIGIHFPYIISKDLLEVPQVGFINLHPAFLPFNKGWNTPSWAILDGTPYGATLHFMEEKLDAGNIILQKEIQVDFCDTANTLYQKVLDLEFEVFKDSFQQLLSLNPKSYKQTVEGTSYKKSDLKSVQRLNLENNISVGELLNKLKGLTTNNINEAAYVEYEGKKIALQIKLVPLDN
jgi:methionyl-tRNA formyltransferase